ncbi:MAG: hypothetical protein M3O34_10845 [Chloroflexota bacterium]|nr:hypothetical protein [Chloroflexota bacterium]
MDKPEQRTDEADDGNSVEELVERIQTMPASGIKSPVDALNPEAGFHRIPNDPREIRAALRAGEWTWRRFPYYEQRYGERGRRFTRSDSAWIVTLAEYPVTVAEKHLRWLGTLLAARGMPRWLLETHLGALYEELVAEVPEKRAAYASLLHVARAFGDERRRYVDDVTAASLAVEFDRRVGPEWSARLPETGALLAAAVADERAGIERAVPSILEWIADPVRFPPEWVAAVHRTIDEAQARSRST